MWNRQLLKMEATWAYKRNYGQSVLVALIIGIVAGAGSFASGFSNGYDSGASSYDLEPSISMSALIIMIVLGLISFAVSLLLTNPLVVGSCRFFVKNFDENAEFSELGFAFKSGHYGNVIGVMFLKDLFIGLWSLLLIVPGIIKAYEYRMVPYLVSENPALSWSEARDISKRMMDGNKWDAFVLDLSFIGWNILGVLTCGILSILMVNPYIFSTNANLFRVLANKEKPVDYSLGANQPGYNPSAAGATLRGQNMYQQPAQPGQPMQSAPNFDPYTGQPVNQQAPKFDPYTGQPLNQDQPAAPQQPVEPQQPAEPVTSEPSEADHIFDEFDNNGIFSNK